MRILTDYILRDNEWLPEVADELGCPFTLGYVVL